MWPQRKGGSSHLASGLHDLCDVLIDGSSMKMKTWIEEPEVAHRPWGGHQRSLSCINLVHRTWQGAPLTRISGMVTLPGHITVCASNHLRQLLRRRCSCHRPGISPLVLPQCSWLPASARPRRGSPSDGLRSCGGPGISAVCWRRPELGTRRWRDRAGPRLGQRAFGDGILAGATGSSSSSDMIIRTSTKAVSRPFQEPEMPCHEHQRSIRSSGSRGSL